MKCEMISNKSEWTSWQRESKGDFLQSWEWGQFQEAYGRRVWRFGLRKNGRILAGWQAIHIPVFSRFSYLYVPRPGAFSSLARESELALLEFAEGIAKKSNASFLRFDCIDPPNDKKRFVKKTFAVQPKEELVMDISHDEEKILSLMKQKTRYNIRLAEKKGVSVRAHNFPFSDEDTNCFWNLVQKTTERQDISPHPKKYYERMLRVLGEEKIAFLYVAYYEHAPAAAAIVAYSKDAALYLHGGSDNALRSIMAPYLLHWHVIRDAKNAGMKKYNLGGVSGTRESWTGITRFKEGFQPEAKPVLYSGVWDVPVQKGRYFLYSVYKMLRK